jgi:hypothetical protein
MLKKLFIALVLLGGYAIPTHAEEHYDKGFNVDFVNLEMSGGCKCIEARFKRVSNGELRYYRYYYEETGNNLDGAKFLVSILLSAQQANAVVNVFFPNTIAGPTDFARFSGVTIYPN